jgi:hypothetical protein
MLTTPGINTIINIAARVAAQMVDLAQRLAGKMFGQRSRLLFDKQRGAKRQRAACQKTAAQFHRAEITHPHHIG